MFPARSTLSLRHTSPFHLPFTICYISNLFRAIPDSVLFCIAPPTAQTTVCQCKTKIKQVLSLTRFPSLSLHFFFFFFFFPFVFFFFSRLSSLLLDYLFLVDIHLLSSTPTVHTKPIERLWQVWNWTRSITSLIARELDLCRDSTLLFDHHSLS